MIYQIAGAKPAKVGCGFFVDTHQVVFVDTHQVVFVDTHQVVFVDTHQKVGVRQAFCRSDLRKRN
jgi:hypothetical protein